ncbi:hypothetical protein JKP88DRAFT_246709 [Tribonema minus]|uniref:Uncharacterized protein n=1 Tax=Tribonema minus TaxID=303371 RepID=A0A836CCJ1_9STRA|nr:hypothetical protein JKP88DRAFT_246709 [Tribonema minus]
MAYSENDQTAHNLNEVRSQMPKQRTLACGSGAELLDSEVNEEYLIVAFASSAYTPSVPGKEDCGTVEGSGGCKGDDAIAVPKLVATASGAEASEQHERTKEEGGFGSGVGDKGDNAGSAERAPENDGELDSAWVGEEASQKLSHEIMQFQHLVALNASETSARNAIIFQLRQIVRRVFGPETVFSSGGSSGKRVIGTEQDAVNACEPTSSSTKPPSVVQPSDQHEPLHISETSHGNPPLKRAKLMEPNTPGSNSCSTAVASAAEDATAAVNDREACASSTRDDSSRSSPLTAVPNDEKPVAVIAPSGTVVKTQPDASDTAVASKLGATSQHDSSTVSAADRVVVDSQAAVDAADGGDGAADSVTKSAAVAAVLRKRTREEEAGQLQPPPGIVSDHLQRIAALNKLQQLASTLRESRGGIGSHRLGVLLGYYLQQFGAGKDLAHLLWGFLGYWSRHLAWDTK